MKCPACGKDSNVTIGNRVYCTGCGAVVQDNTPPAAAEPAPSPAKTGISSGRLMDISKGSAVPLATSQPATPAAPRPVVTPIASARLLQDVVVPAAAKRPAAEYHAQPTANASIPAGVTPTPQPTPAPLIVSALAPVTAAPEPMPVVPKPVAAVPAAASEPLAPITEHISTPLPAPTPVPAPASAADQKTGERLAAAVTVPKSDQISKFQATEAPPATTIAASNATAPEPSAPAVLDVAAPELPAAVATQHEALGGLIAPGAPADQTRNQAFDLAMKATAPAAKPNLAAIAGATLAIIVMGSYIWLQNYPRMQLSVIAGKAGFTASLPGYVPSSYDLHGGVAYSAGQVTLHYTAPGQPGFSISQHITSWDSASLLDNYVAKQTADYSAVQGQGLTIYLYGKGDAAWVNHGLWYSITGDTNLSRSQILNIVYSL